MQYCFPPRMQCWVADDGTHGWRFKQTFSRLFNIHSLLFKTCWFLSSVNSGMCLKHKTETEKKKSKMCGAYYLASRSTNFSHALFCWYVNFLCCSLQSRYTLFSFFGYSFKLCLSLKCKKKKLKVFRSKCRSTFQRYKNWLHQIMTRWFWRHF